MSASDCIDKLDNIHRPMQICFVDAIVSRRTDPVRRRPDLGESCLRGPLLPSRHTSFDVVRF
jgi:hypothetical protein